MLAVRRNFSRPNPDKENILTCVHVNSNIIVKNAVGCADFEGNCDNHECLRVTCRWKGKEAEENCIMKHFTTFSLHQTLLG